MDDLNYRFKNSEPPRWKRFENRMNSPKIKNQFFYQITNSSMCVLTNYSMCVLLDLDTQAVNQFLFLHHV